MNIPQSLQTWELKVKGVPTQERDTQRSGKNTTDVWYLPFCVLYSFWGMHIESQVETGGYMEIVSNKILCWKSTKIQVNTNHVFRSMDYRLASGPNCSKVFNMGRINCFDNYVRLSFSNSVQRHPSRTFWEIPLKTVGEPLRLRPSV